MILINMIVIRWKSSFSHGWWGKNVSIGKRIVITKKREVREIVHACWSSMVFPISITRRLTPYSQIFDSQVRSREIFPTSILFHLRLWCFDLSHDDYFEPSSSYSQSFGRFLSYIWKKTDFSPSLQHVRTPQETPWNQNLMARSLFGDSWRKSSNNGLITRLNTHACSTNPAAKCSPLIILSLHIKPHLSCAWIPMSSHSHFFSFFYIYPVIPILKPIWLTNPSHPYSHHF